MVSSHSYRLVPTPATRARLGEAATQELQLLVEQSVVDQPTRVSSGRVVDSYLSGHLITASARALRLIGPIIAAQAQALGASHVAGEETACIPLLVTATLHAESTGVPLGYFSVRKHPKPPFGWLSTAVPRDARVLLVDDVAGLGHSLRRVAARVAEYEIRPAGAFVIVDRRDGAAAALSAVGISLGSLFTYESSPMDAEVSHGVRSRIIALLHEQFNVDPRRVTATVTLEELGIDSLSLLGVANALENEFGIAISTEDIEEFVSVESLVVLATQRLPRQPVRGDGQ